MSVKRRGVESSLLAQERRRIDRAVDRRAALRDRTRVLAEQFRLTKERHAVTENHRDYEQAIEIHRAFVALSAELEAEGD